jgi:glutaminyl-peptide cyclotransferase
MRPRPAWPRLRPRDRLILVIVLGVVTFGLATPVVQRLLRSREASANVATPAAPIDGERAYRYLKQLCALGPRPAGSAANTRQRALVAKHFKEMGATVREQPFATNDPRSGARVDMVNLIGSWHHERTERVLLGVHYDTRPFPDQDPNPARRRMPFLGANDGASGVALLMEIAHHLKELPTSWGVDLVLFDGEELVYGQDGEYFLGSKAFARAYVEEVDARETKSHYVAGVVLDMIGDKNLQIDQEPYSLDLAPRLVQEVWAVARRLKVPVFRNRVGRAVLDDHLPLNNAGIPAIDIIDFDYPHWHTAGDLPEQCSAESLDQVGRVVTAWLAQPRSRRR